MHSEQAELAEVLGKLADWEVTDLEPFRDMRNDMLGAELADRVADRDLVVGERRVEAERVVRVESRRFVSAHWLILPSAGRRSH
jgi:hypothetical protein